MSDTAKHGDAKQSAAAEGIRSGTSYTHSLDDGRSVFVNGERVRNVAQHPAFRNTVRTIARLHDMSAAAANRDVLTFQSPKTGAPVHKHWMIPRSPEDLRARRAAFIRWAEATCGHMGRMPDVGSFLTGFAAAPEIFARGGSQFANNVLRFYEKARDQSIYMTYVVVPPQIDRSQPAHLQEEPDLYAGVVAEKNNGIVVRGAQMLGTNTAISDYVLLSCIHPMRPGEENYAISCMIPVAADGLRIYARRSYSEAATSLFDYPLSRRFDEPDCFVVFDNVFVPWENVFVYRNIELARAQWFATPSHVYGNHQAQTRFAVKMRFLMGLAKKITVMNGVDSLPPVQGMLGEMGAYAALFESLLEAQENNCTYTSDGVAVPGRQQHYASQVLQTVLFPHMIDLLRELAGGGVLQLPSSVYEYDDAEMAADIERYIRSPGVASRERVGLMKLAWDAIGSEFAGRHHQYEKFFAGAPFIVKTHVYRHYDYSEAMRLVDEALSNESMAGYDPLGLT